MPFQYTAPIFEDHLTPNGLLPRQMKERASCAWQIARLCIIALERVPEQAVLEGEVDQTVKLRNIADGVCLQYNEKIEDVMVFMDFCKAEALRIGFHWPQRFDAWLATGGKSYNELTREPEALNRQ